MDHQQLQTYLQKHTVLTLATTGPAGVWAAALYYVNKGATFYFLSAPHTRHSQNVAQNPQIAATIQENYSNWEEIKGVQLEGTCTLVPAEKREQVINLYAQKFPIIGDSTPPQIAKALDKINWYQIRPKTLYFINNSKGLGHREQVDLAAFDGAVPD